MPTFVDDVNEQNQGARRWRMFSRMEGEIILSEFSLTFFKILLRWANKNYTD